MNTNTPDEIKIIKWQLSCIIADKDKLSMSDLEWAIRMEDAFSKQGSLSPKQMIIVENLYTKYA